MEHGEKDEEEDEEYIQVAKSIEVRDGGWQCASQIVGSCHKVREFREVPDTLGNLSVQACVC